MDRIILVEDAVLETLAVDPSYTEHTLIAGIDLTPYQDIVLVLDTANASTHYSYRAVLRGRWRYAGYGSDTYLISGAANAFVTTLGLNPSPPMGTRSALMPDCLIVLQTATTTGQNPPDRATVSAMLLGRRWCC